MYKLLAIAVLAALTGCQHSNTTTLPPQLEPTKPVEPTIPKYPIAMQSDYDLLDNIKAQAAGYFDEPGLMDVYQYFGLGGTFDDGLGNMLTIYGTTYRYLNGNISIKYDYAAIGNPCITIYVGAHEFVHADQIKKGWVWDFTPPYMQQLHEIDAYTRGPIFAKYFAGANGYDCKF